MFDTMKRFAGLLSVLSTVAALPIPAARAANASAAARPKIVIDGRGVDIDLKNIPIGDALSFVAQAAGLSILLFGESDEKLTVRFSEPSVTEALRRLLRGRDLMFVYDKPVTAAPGWSASRLIELLVFESAGATASTVRRFGSTGLAADDSKRLARPQYAREWSAYVTALVQQLRDAKDPEARKAAAAALATSGDPAAIDILADALQADQNPSVRAAIAHALGKTWDNAAIGPLSQSLALDRSAAVREAAAAALGRSWSEAASMPLLQALTRDRDALVREQAARALGHSGGEDAVAVLALALTQDPRSAVREAAVEALSAIGGIDARMALIKAAESDSDPWVKETALLSVMETKW